MHVSVCAAKRHPCISWSRCGATSYALLTVVAYNLFHDPAALEEMRLRVRCGQRSGVWLLKASRRAWEQCCAYIMVIMPITLRMRRLHRAA